MARQVVLDSPDGSLTRMQLLTPTDSSVSTATMIPTGNGPNKVSGRACSKVGEVVGGTAAVCCCGPCAVMHLLILAVYRVPSGLCKRAWRKKKRMQKRRLLSKKNRNSSLVAESALQPKKIVGPRPIGLGLALTSDDGGGEESDTEEKESGDDVGIEMWEQFYRGFWRSTSQKED